MRGSKTCVTAIHPSGLRDIQRGAAVHRRTLLNGPDVEAEEVVWLVEEKPV
ncbi:hypothetical protein ACFLYD_09225 [Chloroflexota bacterium]